MHEFSVVTYLLETVEAEAREHGASRVLTIDLVIGDRASIVDESLFFYFDMLKSGTLAEDAKLTARRVPSEFDCLECGNTYVASDDFHCPVCGGIGRVSSKGSEFYIESIEIEKEEACLSNK
jgi:hydrogenase nickel incorporation protein HypA/HybF